MYGQELEEFEEPLDLLKQHVKTIADAIRNANHVVVYTGAGISTSASIPGKSTKKFRNFFYPFQITEDLKELGPLETKEEKEPKRQKSSPMRGPPPPITL